MPQLNKLKKYLSILLPMLLIVNFWILYITLPLDGQYGILEDIFCVTCFMYLLITYSGDNRYLVFFRDNKFYNTFIFFLLLLNCCSKIVLLAIFLKYELIPIKSIGVFQDIITNSFFSVGECVKDALGKEIVVRTPDALEHIHLACHTIGVSTAMGGASSLALNTMPLTKKLPTLVKTIPIGVTFIAAGISTYSVEYKKICNIYPHETIFRVQDIPF